MMLLIPAAREKETGGEFFTSLVSPDEMFREKPVILPAPRVRPVPRAQPKAAAPESSVSKSAQRNDTDSLHDGPVSPLLKRGGEGDVKGGQGIPGDAHPEQKSRGSLSKPGNAGPSLKEKLFDESVIGDLAKRHLEREEKEKKDKTFTFDAKAYRFLIYNKRLKERIESIWIYPPDAAARGIYGDLIIRFSIKKNGQLGSVELVRTSGHKTLDDAAIRALKEGAPYWPLPDEWGMDAYTIEGLFVYSLYGYYIL